MANTLKQVQDLGTICWDRYITGFGPDSLYINSYIDECAVKQVNFNSRLPIPTGITGDFTGIKLFTDQNNSYYSQKVKTLKNEFSTSLNVFSNSGYLKMGDILNSGDNMFNEINFITDSRHSELNIIKTKGKSVIDIDINTKDFPEGKLAKFRCIKFDPKEKEETCIKILSTKEIILKCCSQGFTGPGGSDGEGGFITGPVIEGVGGGNGIAGLEGPIGLGGVSLIGIDGIIGIEGPIYQGEAIQGIQGEMVNGTIGSIGNEGFGINGDNGLGGQTQSSTNAAQGLEGIDGQIAAPNLSSAGEIGESLNGLNGIQGIQNTTATPDNFKGQNGLGGQTQSSTNAAQGLEGSQGVQNQGPFFPPQGDGGLNGQNGEAQTVTNNPGINGRQGSQSVTAGSNGGNGAIGLLTPISTFINVGALRAAIVQDVQYVIYGITGFLNPFNKDDTTNNPIYGTQPGGGTPFIP